MKKARIILASIAVVGILGGTLAFKANRGSRTYYVTTSYAAPATLSVANGLIIDAGSPKVYWTTTSGAPAYNYSSIAPNL